MFPPLLAVCKPSFLRNQIVVLELIVAFNRVFVPVQTFPSLQSTLFFPLLPAATSISFLWAVSWWANFA